MPQKSSARHKQKKRRARKLARWREKQQQNKAAQPQKPADKARS